MTVSATFDFDPKEHYRALLGVWRFNPGRRLALVLGVGVPLVMLFIVGQSFGEAPLSALFWSYLPWLLLGAFYLSLVPLLLRSAARKAFENDPSLRGPQTRTVSPSGLQVKGEGLTQDIGWNDMVRLVETPEFFFFFYNRQVAHFLPKRVLSDAQIYQVRELVQANFPGRALLQSDT